MLRRRPAAHFPLELETLTRKIERTARSVHPHWMLTDRLLIRPVRASDAEVLYSIRQLVGQRRTNRTLEEVRESYREMEKQSDAASGYQIYAVELNGGEGVIGDLAVAFNTPGEQQAEIGYSLHPGHWGRGYASEAVGAMLGYLFAQHQMHRIVAISAAENTHSRVLLERLGFRLEGHHKDGLFNPQLKLWVDTVAYALLAHEWTGSAR